MGFKSYNPNERYKARAANRFASLLAYLAVILVSCLLGFWLGKQFAAEELIMVSSKIKTLEQTVSEQSEKITELGAVAETSTIQYKQLQERVSDEKPEGEALALLNLIQRQLDKGMDAKRVQYLIKSGRPPTDCKEPKIKRFVAATPLYKGPKSVMSIEDGLVTINGQGVSAKNKEGKEEVWYDPTRGVDISFFFEGKTVKRKGVMPLYKTIITGDREYRFTVEPGAQSFIKVTYDSCAYP